MKKTLLKLATVQDKLRTPPPHIFISKFEHEIISVFDTETGYAILNWKLGNSYTPLEEIFSWWQTFEGNTIKNVTFFPQRGIVKTGRRFYRPLEGKFVF